jgi:inhibitor of cysteine peptidase
MSKEIKLSHALAVIFAVGLIAALVIIGFSKSQYLFNSGNNSNKPGAGKSFQASTDLNTIQRFASEADFKKYLEKSKEMSGFSGGVQMLGGMRNGTTSWSELSADSSPKSALPMTTGLGSGPERVSETNVQVAGIDEPDILKTDGKEAYFSAPQPVVMPMDDTVGRSDESKELWPLNQTGGIKAIKAYPLDSLTVDNKIQKSGNMLLKNNILAVLPDNNYYYDNRQNKIIGYDVSNPKDPKEKWNIELKNNTQVQAARLYGDKIYLVTKNSINADRPCPLEPFSVNGKSFSIGCLEINHPVAPISTDVTYTVTKFEMSTGETKETATFVGSSSDSVIYMSPDSIYATYYYPGDFIKFTIGFFEKNADLMPVSVTEKLKKLEGYDIGANAKMTEYSDILQQYQNSLSSDDRMKLENEMRNRMENYFKDHKRDLERTGIVRISVSDLSVDASGAVPGKPLNQFSLDEYQNHLRIATTVGSGWWGFGFGGNSDSANDVYVLDKELRTTGSIMDLGEQEKIYSARFVEDKGYLVTFRQTDPFYVLDLSDPQNPKKSGELKIPGYSSYLHPISKDKILGIGEENNQVKISLFDVSSPQNPREIAKYNLDEYYSEISSTHHAFLLDPKHQIFFLPGTKGGYVFSYADDNLKLEKAVSDIQAKRAVYINDFLYVFSTDRLIVLNENNWERAGELEL